MVNSSNKPKSFNVFDEDLSEESFNLFSAQNRLAIDTEAMGLIHGRDRLCLVQICDKEDNVCCIKIKPNQSKAKRLQSLFENPRIEKVFHFARFDVAALKANLDINVKCIFCTKIASKIGRTYSPRHGLKEVIMELVGVELDKQAQSSDWGKVHELSETQLAYAANDVRYLLPARQRLYEMLERENRWELTQKCFDCISVIAELDRYRFTNIFEH
tara:strand:- start:4660 stop:5304 length:645 start_codon:yes stop_codon:yes gene_type:complete